MESDGHEQQLIMQDSTALPSCPSFSSYSSERFAEIADKVTAEWNADQRCCADTSIDFIDDAVDNDDFEFASAHSNHDVTSDEIFLGGHQFHEIFPIFNRDLLVQADEDRDAKADVPTLRLPLKKFFAEDIEKRDTPSSSSSESDELEGVAPGTYCFWRPNTVEASPSRCKKSSSTGTASKRWNLLLDLLRRSNSEGKADFMILTQKNVEQKATITDGVENSKERQHTSAGKLKAKGVAGDGGSGKGAPSSPHEVFYVRCRASKEGNKRKSYLPYRKDLVGLFAKVNGSGGRAFPPF